MSTINELIVAGISAVVGLGTAYLGFRGTHENTITSVLTQIRQDNQELKDYNLTILEENRKLSTQVNKLIVLIQEMNSDLKRYGKDYSEQIKDITK
ncbi:hypothetical protein [Fructobacillus tropaeoli]|uniref:Uncharacterized protein n=1 Tax=Fructobacillus tropaeoli TaxID=709323 RepID=A0ABM9MN52_9LACO|nr:hypothetical protein [Fructobacillus tropaeoli]GIC70632.1 hypothetical protein FT12353_13080 [Fructobacillus tropaeoli]CAK1228028.1 unnamed protein product [Fructobacillus tropaeoli]